jgi:hypothetical protein
MWVLWNLVSVRLEMELMSCKMVPWYAPNVPLAQKSFWTHPMVLLGYEAQLKAHFGRLGDSANLGAR